MRLRLSEQHCGTGPGFGGASEPYWVPPTVGLIQLEGGLADADRHALPSLPQTPTPAIQGGSRPTMETWLMASGPLPIRVAPLDGRGDPAVFDEVGLGGGRRTCRR